jgi:prepilin-type N-terminal cleavage/methylation domain-containing protein
VGTVMAIEHRARGFTLVELLITVTIVGILATLAAPGLQQLVLASDVRGATSDLQTALYFTRSEAIKRAVNVEIVPASADWKNGWLVRLAGTTTVLSRHDALSDQLSSIAGSTITYRSDGRVTATPATIVITTANTSVQARCIKIDLSGRPNVNNYQFGGGTNTCS